jgi:hypothetical protein
LTFTTATGLSTACIYFILSYYDVALAVVNFTGAGKISSVEGELVAIAIYDYA